MVALYDADNSGRYAICHRVQSHHATLFSLAKDVLWPGSQPFQRQREMDSESDRQTETESERETERHKERQRDIQRERERDTDTERDRET